MVKDTYQIMKIFIEQLSFDVPRGSLPTLYSGLYTWHMQCSSGLDCLGKHIHCGANSGSSFGVKFELTTCEFVFVQYIQVSVLRWVGCNW